MIFLVLLGFIFSIRNPKFLLSQNSITRLIFNFPKSIKLIRSDSGGEFMSAEFSFMSEKGFLYKKSCPHTPQQNSTVEKKKAYCSVCTGYSCLRLCSANIWCEETHTVIHMFNHLLLLFYIIYHCLSHFLDNHLPTLIYVYLGISHLFICLQMSVPNLLIKQQGLFS